VVEAELATMAPAAPDIPREQPPQAAALGAFDAEGNGRALAFVQVESRNTVAIDEAFALVDCRLLPLEENGTTLTLTRGGLFGNYDFYRCDPTASGGPELTSIVANSNGGTHNVDRTVYRLSGTKATKLSHDTLRVSRDPWGGEPTIPGTTGVHCGLGS
jgi:hypothetical protein